MSATIEPDWVELVPFPNGFTGSRADAVIEVMKRLTGFTVRITFSKTCPNAPAAGDRYRIMAASGMVMLKPYTTGKFRIAKGPDGKTEVRLPLFDGLPSHHTRAHPCTVSTCDDGGLIVTLPDGEIPEHTPISRRRSGAAPTKPAQRAAEVEPVQISAGKLDVVSYLTKKGHDCKRIAGGRIQIDGDAYLMSAVLGMVNRIRAKSDQLPPLAMDQIA